jgi:hypothetical protein
MELILRAVGLGLHCRREDDDETLIDRKLKLTYTIVA